MAVKVMKMDRKITTRSIVKKRLIKLQAVSNRDVRVVLCPCQMMVEVER